MHRKILILAALILMSATVLVVWNHLRPPRPGAPADRPPMPPAPSAPLLSVLAQPPDWSRLGRFHHALTRPEFETLLTSVFVTGGRWREFIEIHDDAVDIRHDADPATGMTRIPFASDGRRAVPVRGWRRARELPPFPPGRPLDGLRIAIDPGHLGGPWAMLEERWLQVGDGAPVCEGDMTMAVARHLKPMLEALGASVFLVRDGSDPATRHRPESLLPLAEASAGVAAPDEVIRKTAERLFYRTAEIRARADLVNQHIRPDLVLALHFNAEPWGDASAPQLVDRTHFHVLVNGAYTDDEFAMADQRLTMLEKLLSGTHEEESLLATRIAEGFAAFTGLPPYQYDPALRNVLPVRDHPYVWARNLLANRLYDCPVLFMEPYVMNSTVDYPRMAAGDYEGLREFNGRPMPSILREYATALAKAMEAAYAGIREPGG